MLKNRVCYLTVLLCALLFFICFNGYLSLYVFVLVLAFPFAALLVSLPGMLGVRIELSLGADSARKGQGLPLRLKVYDRFPVAAGRSGVRLTVRNTLTGEEQEERFTFIAGRTPQVLEHQLSSRTCGRVVCRLHKARVCDCLGLFALPLRLSRRAECAALFYPAVHSLDLTVRPAHMPDAEGGRYSPTKPGDDPSELFGLREYRAGDRLSRVHWKLSQKTGQTLVKELSLPISEHILFLLDLNGSGTEADALLDVFATLSGFLAEHETAHRAAYLDGASGCLQFLEIFHAEDARPAVETLLAAGCRQSLPALEEQELPTGVSHVLYLCCSPDPGPVAALRDRYSSARISILQVTEALGAARENRPAAAFAGAELTVVKPGRVPEALGGFEL